jgi:hypothetical protein
MSPAPRALLILGMHRSGTSALAHLLCTLGVDFGRDLMPASPANELGFFEKPEIADANERLLQALGLEGASDPRPLPSGWYGHPVCAPIRGDIVEILRADFDGTPLYAVKDPRICRLVPLWIDVLRELGSEPSFIHITRNPLEVADSLAARQGLDARSAQLLWLRHVLEAERGTRGHRRVFVTYRELLTDWQATADRIGTTLDLSWPNPLGAVSEAAEAVLPDRLRHHQRADEDLSGEDGVSRWVAGAYRALIQLGDGTQSAQTRRLDDIRRNLDAAGELLSGTGASPDSADEPSLTLRYAGTLRWDQGQLDARATAGEIVAGQTVEFDFVASHGNFCGFDLMFGTYARTNTSSLDVQLLIADAGGELEAVHAWTLPASEIGNDAWRAFRCAPQAESRGRRCRVRLTSRDAAAGDAVTIYCDPDGQAAYRAYFVELGAPEESESTLVVIGQLEERIARLEVGGATREALGGVETRLAVLEPRLESELGSTRGAVEELRSAVDAARAELATVRGGGQAEAERLRAELATVRGAGQAEAERLRAELATVRGAGQVEAERLRVELADQRGRLEGVPDQLRTLRELLSATREAGESGRREQQARLAEVEHAFSSTLEELRVEEQALRSALEETSHARIERLERGQSDEQQWHCAHEEATDERFARLESIVLAAVERIDVLNRRTDRDLAAIGAALEEAWE